MKKRLFKRAGSAVLALAVLAGGAAAVLPMTAQSGIEVQASLETYNDFEYFENQDNNIVITGYEGGSSILNIPSKINGKAVVSLSDEAFSENENITEVTIPDSVTYIGDDCFSYCYNLSKITLSKNIKSVNYHSFAYNTKLKEINIPSGVTYIGEYAFLGCSSLSKVTIPDTVTTIESCAFNHCNILKSVYIPSSVKEIGIQAFGFGRDEDSDKLEEDWKIDFTVYGTKGTEAERYANQYKFRFIDPDNIEASSIKLNKSSVSLEQSGSIKLTATFTPDNVKDKTLKWTTSNSKVAVVSGLGLVTAKNNGTAQITATTSNGKTAKCSVTVYGSPTSLSLSSSQMSLGLNETTKLTAKVGPQYAKDKSVKWRTSNSNVLTVDQKGNVKAKGKGTAWITARTVNGIEKSCKITVKNAPSSVKLPNAVLTLGVGETYKLGAIIPDGSASASRTFRTSNSSVVKMTKTNWEGQFKAMKTGTAYVTVRLYNGKEASCKVTVKKAPTSVNLNKTNITMKVGQTGSLSAVISPSDAGCATRTFRTSNSGIVKMTKTNWTGQFKAMKKGVAWVTVRTYNGKEKSCKITVV